jgi:hypothetical protein
MRFFLQSSGPYGIKSVAKDSDNQTNTSIKQSSSVFIANTSHLSE